MLFKLQFAGGWVETRKDAFTRLVEGVKLKG
jgi:hypothetical protein